jgi:hypothetical protein
MRRLMKYAAGAGLVAAIAVAGAAWAWQAGGSGTAKAKAGQSVTLTTVGQTSTGKLLYPGGSGDVKIKIKNDNSFRVLVNAIVISGPVVADGEHPDCKKTGVTFKSPALSGWSVPARQTTELTLKGAVTMSNISDDGCQGATFTIPVVLAGVSNP